MYPAEPILADTRPDPTEPANYRAISESRALALAGIACRPRPVSLPREFQDTATARRETVAYVARDYLGLYIEALCTGHSWQGPRNK